MIANNLKTVLYGGWVNAQIVACYIIFIQSLFSFSGIYTALHYFDKTARGIIYGIIGLIIAAGFGCAAFADLFLISKVRVCYNYFESVFHPKAVNVQSWLWICRLQIHRMYRSTGASFAKAQAEFTTEFLRNQHVRSAASNVAAAAVQSQFSQNQNPNNRY